MNWANNEISNIQEVILRHMEEDNELITLNPPLLAFINNQKENIQSK